MTIVMAQQGWQCPKCGNIISPNMMWCPFCSGEKKVTYTTTSSTPYKVETSSVCKDEPQTGEMMTEEEFDSMLARVLTCNNEPQTERSGR